MKRTQRELLRQFASKYVWWKKPEEAMQWPGRVAVQVMNIGGYDDVQRLVDGQAREGATAPKTSHRMSSVFKPRAEILPASQRKIWPELKGAASLGFVLDDLLATKLEVLLQRVEAKDYLDVAAMLDAGADLSTGLASARTLYGEAFQPAECLKALTYFGGDLTALTPGCPVQAHWRVGSRRYVAAREAP